MYQVLKKNERNCPRISNSSEVTSVPCHCATCNRMLRLVCGESAAHQGSHPSHASGQWSSVISTAGRNRVSVYS